MGPNQWNRSGRLPASLRIASMERLDESYRRTERIDARRSECPTNFLLHETDVGGGAAFGHLLDGAELRFVTGDIFAQRAEDTLGLAGADDHAFEELALLAVGENIDKV